MDNGLWSLSIEYLKSQQWFAWNAPDDDTFTGAPAPHLLDEVFREPHGPWTDARQSANGPRSQALGIEIPKAQSDDNVTHSSCEVR